MHSDRKPQNVLLLFTVENDAVELSITADGSVQPNVSDAEVLLIRGGVEIFRGLGETSITLSPDSYQLMI